MSGQNRDFIVHLDYALILHKFELLVVCDIYYAIHHTITHSTLRAGTILSCLCSLTHLILTIILWRYFGYLHSTDEKTEVQRSYVSCPRLQS